VFRIPKGETIINYSGESRVDVSECVFRVKVEYYVVYITCIN